MVMIKTVGSGFHRSFSETLSRGYLGYDPEYVAPAKETPKKEPVSKPSVIGWDETDMVL